MNPKQCNNCASLIIGTPYITELNSPDEFCSPKCVEEFREKQDDVMLARSIALEVE